MMSLQAMGISHFMTRVYTNWRKLTRIGTNWNDLERIGTNCNEMERNEDKIEPTFDIQGDIKLSLDEQESMLDLKSSKWLLPVG